MSGALACGRHFRTFNVVDDFNHEAMHIEVDTSITSARLVRIFEQLQREHGLPQVLRTDNGPEFLGESFVQWAKANAMTIQLHPTRQAPTRMPHRTLQPDLPRGSPGPAPLRPHR